MSSPSGPEAVAGPFETEAQAIAATRHIPSADRDGLHRLLDEACTGAGVEVAAYEHRVLLWLAGLEPQICAVIAGLITRAHPTGPG